MRTPCVLRPSTGMSLTGTRTRVPLELISMVIRQGMIAAAAGLAIGLLSAWLVSRVLSSLLFGISPRDPMTFAGVAVLLGVVALVACALPAWRVMRVDPLKLLRVE